MKTVDLQIRIARKMAYGKGSMQITQADLDVLVQSGAYASLCDAATKELKEHRSDAPVSRPITVLAQPSSIRSFEVPDDVAAAVERAKASFKQPTRTQLTSSISPALIKCSHRG